MAYDTVEIEDMDWSDELQAFTYQCPCGDLFQITLVRFPVVLLAVAVVELVPCVARRPTLAVTKLGVSVVSAS